MTSSQGYDQAPPGRDRVGALAGLAVLVALLAVGATADLDLDPAGPPVFLASSAWVAVLAFATGWPLPSVVGRRAETIG
jgi:hypothetical protein